MDLQEFVSTSLRQIVDGVNEAKEYAAKLGASVNASGDIINVPGITGRTLFRKTRDNNYQFAQDVGFDVALTTIEEQQKGGGAKLSVLSLSLGGDASSERTNSSVSRVKFTVPVFLP
ncbi:MAG: hypothetical protein KJ749_12465 [Planctomycetes bacterium]|nr:hypothetical protein [Planctomycetota bacterium]